MAFDFFAKILTLFPEMFPGTLARSVLSKSKGVKWDIETVNIRDYAYNKHQTVDDKPAGGGNGMLLKPDVLSEAIEQNQKDVKKIYLMSPRGRVLNQQLAQEIVSQKNIMMICGRYEGVDQRVIDYYQLEELSIGDYVLSGGELAAQVILDSCIRLIDGVIEDANNEESFNLNGESNLLEYPQYTKPNEWQGKKIPDILLSGNHKKIAEWRLEQAENITKERRKDLWIAYQDKK